MRYADPEAQKRIDELEAKLARVKALVPEWEESIAEDEAWLDNPRAHYTECEELPAVIGRTRAIVGSLRKALES